MAANLSVGQLVGISSQGLFPSVLRFKRGNVSSSPIGGKEVVELFVIHLYTESSAHGVLVVLLGRVCYSTPFLPGGPRALSLVLCEALKNRSSIYLTLQMSPG